MAKILAAVERSKAPAEQHTPGFFEKKLEIPHGSVGNTLTRLVRGGFLKRVVKVGMRPYYVRTSKVFENLTRGQRITTQQRDAFAAALEGIPAAKLRAFMEGLDDVDNTIFVRRIRATVPWSYDKVAEHTQLSRPTIQKRQKALLDRLVELKKGKKS